MPPQSDPTFPDGARVTHVSMNHVAKSVGLTRTGVVQKTEIRSVWRKRKQGHPVLVERCRVKWDSRHPDSWCDAANLELVE